MDRHAPGCTQATHKSGKWCWLPEEIASLEEQSKEIKSWNEISESFTINGVKRHGTHQCATKYFKLLLEKPRD